MFSYTKVDAATMTVDELRLFLQQEQNWTIDSQQAKSLIDSHEFSTAKQEGLLTIAGLKLL